VDTARAEGWLGLGRGARRAESRISEHWTFSEEWLLHFNALVGGKPISPIEISVARKNSAYFAATEAQTPAMALFFLKSTEPHHLEDLRTTDADARKALEEDEALVPRGKEIFAERCARCHSSKLPEFPPDVAGDCAL